LKGSTSPDPEDGAEAAPLEASTEDLNGSSLDEAEGGGGGGGGAALAAGA